MRAMRPRTEALLLVGVWGVVAALAVALGILYPSPTQDTMCRYAVMAENFAAGNWFEAFHPRFCVLYPVLTGLTLKLTGMNSLFVCCAVAMVGWSLGVFPLFRIARNVFGSACAWFAVGLYIVCPQLIFWGFQGLREPWRVFALLMMVAGLFEPRERRGTAFLELLVGVMISVTLRVDAIAAAGLFILAYFAVERFSWRSWLVCLWGVLWVQPCCYLTYVWTGLWIPGPPFAPLFRSWLS